MKTASGYVLVADKSQSTMYAITKMPPEIVCLLIDGFPDALRQENNTGLMPLDLLCRKKYLDDAAA